VQHEQKQQQYAQQHLRNPKRSAINGTSSSSFTVRLSANWRNTTSAALPVVVPGCCVISSVN
jgi:hypothetical protein